jgi:histidinol-phosphate/aromatic aminotransferase/cobyric acid decarboxylase-like protein
MVTSFGLSNFVRVSSRGREENRRLVEALVDMHSEVTPCNS